MKKPMKLIKMCFFYFFYKSVFVCVCVRDAPDIKLARYCVLTPIHMPDTWPTTAGYWISEQIPVHLPDVRPLLFGWLPVYYLCYIFAGTY